MDNTSIKIFLDQVLTIINYQKDKDFFTNNFISFSIQKSLEEYIELLPEERKNEIQSLLNENDPNELQEKIKPYIQTEEYKNLLQENTKKLFLDYLGAIMPTVSEEQKSKLEAYFLSFKPDQPMVSS